MATSGDIFQIIQTAPESQVRSILRLLCESSLETQTEAKQFYKTILQYEQTAAVQQAVGTNGPSLKRKSETEVLFCVNCEDCFVEAENHKTACSYHPGKYEADYDDFFADHEESIHGKIDDDGMFQECPEGYFMDCCRKRGDTKGCVVAAHESRESGKLGRNGESGEESQDDESEEEYEDDEEDEDEDNDDEEE